MTTILAIFGCAFLISMWTTPLIGRLGFKLGIVDTPGQRKVHYQPTPRTGGISVVIAFLAALALAKLTKTGITQELRPDFQNMMLLAGGLVVFATGLVDDFRRLGPWVKLSLQILAASLAYLGGLHLFQHTYFQVLPWFFNSWPLSYGITVFWFLLFINAVNLIDGLDGLAGGITFFACLVMVITLTLNHNIAMAVVFAALAGAILGFLRYNFNPASVFLGDGGSYFLGYTLAGLAILGSVRSSLGTAMLIPLVALGVPVLDTILSPLRRFILGRNVFQPDKSHIHHCLKSMGLSTRVVVLLLYAITVGLSLLGVALAYSRDWKLSLILVLLGAGVILLVRKVGYFDYFTSEKILGWIKDITDVTGVSRERRSFLGLQVDTSNSASFEELWENTTRALKVLGFDYGALYLNGFTAQTILKCQKQKHFPWGFSDPNTGNLLLDSPPENAILFQSLLNSNFDLECQKEKLLRIELPLVGNGNTHYGTFLLLRDLHLNGLSHVTLRRVEQLRRTLIMTLEKLKDQNYEFGQASLNYSASTHPPGTTGPSPR